MAAPRVRSAVRPSVHGPRRGARPAGRLTGPGPSRPSSGQLPRSEVAELQRARLLTAAVGEIDERGYECTTVGHITGRARVSRRTFYDLFDGREECLAAILDELVLRVGRELHRAGLEGFGWRERVRGGLWVILSLLGREPALARVCLVETLRAGGVALEHRERTVARLVALVDEGRRESTRGAECSALTAEGVVGAALSIVHARVSRRDAQPLTGLLGELMGMIVLPYLGTAAARRERTRPAPAPLFAPEPPPQAVPVAEDPFEGLSMRLTYRTVRVLESVGEFPGSSNRQVADRAGVSDPGQVSKLLRRLERLGLVVNEGKGRYAKGEPNAWALTLKGQQVTQRIRVHIAGGELAA